MRPYIQAQCRLTLFSRTQAGLSHVGLLGATIRDLPHG